MSQKLSQFSVRVMSGSEAAEMRDFLGHGVNANRHLGKSEAVFRVAKEIGIPPGRVVKIMRGEIRRVWADEFRAAKSWYRALVDKEIARADHEAAILRARREQMDAEDA